MPSIIRLVPTAVLALTAFASPLAKRANQCPDNKNYASGSWCSDDGGNVDMQISDAKTDWGSVNPGDLIGSARDKCTGGTCPDAWELETSWINDKHEKEDGKISVKVTTQVTDGAHLPLMFDALQFMLDRVKDVETKTFDHTACYPVGTTPSCNHDKDVEYEQTKGPQVFEMQIRDKSSDNDLFDKPIVSSITIQVDKEVEGTSGLCGAIAGAGAGVAGGANGILGAVGALAALACLGTD